MADLQTNVAELQKQFLHEILQPYQTLVSRSTRNDLVGAKVSDITAASNALAVSAAHFTEARKLPPGNADDERLRQMLKDVADSAKHGSLAKPDRTVELEASLTYEIDEDQGHRFLRTEVWASYNRFGSFNLIETLGRYAEALNERFSLGFKQIEPSIELKPFDNHAEAKISRNTFDVGSVHIRTYKRDASGSLVLADPAKFTFVVI